MKNRKGEFCPTKLKTIFTTKMLALKIYIDRKTTLRLPNEHFIIKIR